MTDRSITVNSRIWILVLCLCIPAWSGGLQAQSAPASQFTFPRFVSYPEINTGIAIFNPSPGTATVTLTLWSYDGSLVAGVTNPATLTIPAHGQAAKMASELFVTAANIDASLEISSSTPGLVAYYQTFDPAVTFLDGGSAPEASTDLIFPVVPAATEGSCEIDFVNPNPRETSVELKLWHFDGHLLGTATIQVPGGGIYRNLAPDLFPAGTDFRGASHITATSKPRNVLSAAQTVAGTSLFAGFSSYAPLGAYVDLAALNAVPVTGTSNSAAIPYFRTGSRYASTLSIANVEPAAVNVIVTAVANNGSILGTRTINLNAQGGLRAPMQSIITALGSGDQEGWLLIQASGRVTGALIYGQVDAASLAAVPFQKAPKVEFVFPQVVQGFGSYTEISLVNPTPSTSYANVWLIGANGATLAVNQIVLGPSKRASLSLKQLLPEMANQAGGVVYIGATGALFANAAIWSDSGSTASNFTPQDISFLPAPLTRFAVTGKVYFNQKPESGMHVVLSGPVAQQVWTDQDGAYRFVNLPAGSYTLTVDQPGMQFIPAQASFEIKTSSIRQDFQAFTDDNEIVVQPGSVAVGSPNTKLVVFGKDFDATSEAFAGATALKTTIMDSTRVLAVFPASMTVSPSILEITVVTSGPDGSRRATRPFSFVVYPDKPVLNALVTSEPPLLIMEGSTGRNITLQGTGFLKGAKVKVNGSADGIQANVIDDKEIQAYVPASYFERGGNYPVTVENPAPAKVESNLQLLPVYFWPPAIDAIYPKSVTARIEEGAAPVSLDVMGFGFRRGAVVLFNDTPLVTTYCESDAYCLTVHLFAKIPAELLQTAGFGKIEVQNPDPSVGNSQAQYMRVDGLQPAIFSVQPGSGTLMNSPFTVTMPIVVDGANFGPDITARVYKADADPLPPFSKGQLQVLSSSQILLSVAMDYPDALGEWKVQVANPPPGGGVSEAISFFVTDGSFVGNPFLISLNPKTVAAGGPSFTLTINGTNFKPGTVINFNYTPLVTTVVSDRQVRAQVPASLIRFAGRVPISVTNPDTGGTSNRLFLDIR